MIECKSNGEEESIKQRVQWHTVITLLGIYGNEDKFDKDEHIRIFTMVLFISVKKLKCKKTCSLFGVM